MDIPFPEPRQLPCSECGAAVEQSRHDEHVCDCERRLDYQLFQPAEPDGLDREEVAADRARALETQDL